MKVDYKKMTYDEESTEELEQYLEKVLKLILQNNQEETIRHVKRIG